MTASADKQWRIDNASHLKGLRLQFRRYTRWSESWDHDHCAACWAKFAEFEGSDIQQEGYTTCDDYPKGARYEWVCRTCFDDLRDDMQWSATTALWPGFFNSLLARLPPDANQRMETV